jgi:hypothetical protein
MGQFTLNHALMKHGTAAACDMCAVRAKREKVAKANQGIPAEISAAVHAWDGSIQQLLSLSEQVHLPFPAFFLPSWTTMCTICAFTYCGKNMRVDSLTLFS